MKLKKVTKNGNYNVIMSQQELNVINDLLCYVNPWHTEHEVIKGNCENLMKFFQEHSTLEFEDLFGTKVVGCSYAVNIPCSSVKPTRYCECCGEPLVELVPIKEQVIV